MPKNENCITPPWKEEGVSYAKWIRERVGHAPVGFNAATVVVLNDKAEILLERRGDDGKWTVPSRVQSPDDHPAAAAIAGLKEETGVDVLPEDLHLLNIYGGQQQFHHYPNGDEAFFNKIVYVAKKYSGEIEVNNESSEARFFSLKELPEPHSGSTTRIANEILSRWLEIDLW